MTADDFGLELILAEEGDAGPGDESPGGGPSLVDTGTDRTLVYDESDLSISGQAYISPDDEGLYVPGPGRLDTVMVLADADTFGIRVLTEIGDFINDDYTTLQASSSELPHVAAFKRQDGTRTISVSGVEYATRVGVVVRGWDGVTFSRIRAVYTVDGGVDVAADTS